MNNEPAEQVSGNESSGDESGSVSLGPLDRSQLNVRVTDGTYHKLKALKERWPGETYGKIVEESIQLFWSANTELDGQLLDQHSYNSMQVRIDRWRHEGNTNYALHLFQAHFGQLWASLRAACKRLEAAGLELPLRR